MREAWIIDLARSPRGIPKEGKGSLVGIHPQRLLSQILSALEVRNRLNNKDIEQAIIGCNNQQAEQGGSIARMAALDAGWYETSGSTVDHFCGSGMAASIMAATAVMAGVQDLVVSGGIEMPSMKSSYRLDTDRGNMHLREMHPITGVGISADIIATEEGFSREDVDQYAAASQQRACHAVENGYFEKSLVPIFRDDGSLAMDAEELHRPDTTAETLATLEPSFKAMMDYAMDEHHSFGDVARMKWPALDINHVHHAGNSSVGADCASGVVIASSDYAKTHDLRPRAKIVSMAHAAGSPEYNLNEPCACARKLLDRAGMVIGDIDLFEVNEAFAVVPLRFMRHLDVPHDELNVNGGAIALGHPTGATGGVLLGVLLDELERRDLSTGLVTMCAAGGMAPGMIIERT